MPDPDFYYLRVENAINMIADATYALQMCAADHGDEVDRIIYWAEVLTVEANHLRHVAQRYKQEVQRDGS